MVFLLQINCSFRLTGSNHLPSAGVKQALRGGSVEMEQGCAGWTIFGLIFMIASYPATGKNFK
jgi:hypothetical protein